MTPHVGMLFVHATRLDPFWRPGAGEKYVDAPHEIYRVTRVASGRVYYRPLTASKTRDYSSLETFSAKVLRVLEA